VKVTQRRRRRRQGPLAGELRFDRGRLRAGPGRKSASATSP